MKVQIKCTTDSYHASMDPRFDSTNTFIVDEFNSLKEAYKALLDIYNRLADEAGAYRFPNWGLAAAWEGDSSLRADKTYGDGTRSFRYDVYDYSTELVEDE